MSATNLVSTVEKLLRDVKEMEVTDDGREKKRLRHAVTQAALAVGRDASDPIDYMKGQWVKMAEIGAWNLFMEWKVFDKIPDSESISFEELAASVDAEPGLVSRIATVLIATGLLAQPKPGHVQHTALSPLYKADGPAGPLNWVAIALGLRPYLAWPEYFEKYGRREPRTTSPVPGSFAWGHPEVPIWDVIAQNPEHARIFAASMKIQSIHHAELVGEAAQYSLKWVGEEIHRHDAPLLVDVGGGHGQLLKSILSEVPGIPTERCVLQERGEVIDEARRLDDPALAGISYMAHDFHKEQPVKGALVYILRRILHNWDDEACVTILSHLAEALPDNPKARVILAEPRRKCPPDPFNAIVDTVMLNIGGKVRNEILLAPIVNAAGLKIVGAHYEADDEGHVIECAKA